MRKSIFDIVSEKINMQSELSRILHVATVEKTLCIDNYIHKTIFEFVDAYCFDEWKSRNHFINVDDFLNALNYDKIVSDAQTNVESFMTLIELVCNFWHLCFQKLKAYDNDYEVRAENNFYHLHKILVDILEEYNHKAIFCEEKDCIWVVEDNEAVTAVVEILPQALSYDVIKYNHRTLRGEIGAKKSILLSMGSALEPKRNELKGINRELENNIFFMLNNINIRHNNRSDELNGNYKEYVAKMSDEELEDWYDELYQMMLLAFLLLDNVERTKKVRTLKTKIAGGNEDGQA